MYVGVARASNDVVMERWQTRRYLRCVHARACAPPLRHAVARLSGCVARTVHPYEMAYNRQQPVWRRAQRGSPAARWQRASATRAHAGRRAVRQQRVRRLLCRMNLLPDGEGGYWQEHHDATRAAVIRVVHIVPQAASQRRYELERGPACTAADSGDVARVRVLTSANGTRDDVM